jgi:hypothetical protein
LRKRNFTPGILLFALPILGGVGVVLWFGGLLSWQPLSHFLALRSYQQAKCTIISKDLTYSNYHDDQTDNDTTTYSPEFTYVVHEPSGATVRVQGYGIDQPSFDQRSDAGAILARYAVGQTYPCWYEPAHPEHAVLTQGITEWWLLLPGGIMLLVGLGMLVGAGLFIRKAGKFFRR